MSLIIISLRIESWLILGFLRYYLLTSWLPGLETLGNYSTKKPTVQQWWWIFANLSVTDITIDSVNDLIVGFGIWSDLLILILDEIKEIVVIIQHSTRFGMALVYDYQWTDSLNSLVCEFPVVISCSYGLGIFIILYQNRKSPFLSYWGGKINI